MPSQKFDPMKELSNLKRSVGKVVEQGLNVVTGSPEDVALEMYQLDDQIIVRTSPIEGILADSLEVSVENGVLTIVGETKAEELPPNASIVLQEKRFGVFSRSVAVPVAVKAEEAQAKLKDGMLVITFPIDHDSSHNIKVTPVE